MSRKISSAVLRSSAASASRAPFDPADLRVGQPCTFEGELRVRIFFELDQYIAIGEPRAVTVPALRRPRARTSAQRRSGLPAAR